MSREKRSNYAHLLRRAKECGMSVREIIGGFTVYAPEPEHEKGSAGYMKEFCEILGEPEDCAITTNPPGISTKPEEESMTESDAAYQQGYDRGYKRGTEDNKVNDEYRRGWNDAVIELRDQPKKMTRAEAASYDRDYYNSDRSPFYFAEERGLVQICGPEQDKADAFTEIAARRRELFHRHFNGKATPSEECELKTLEWVLVLLETQEIDKTDALAEVLHIAKQLCEGYGFSNLRDALERYEEESSTTGGSGE